MPLRRDIRSQVPNGVRDPGQVTTEDIDVLIIGAGFAGCYLLHHFRKDGVNVKIVEAGSDLGGVWYWNRYPGARVDTQYPAYALSIPEVWKDWYWTVEYPDHNELRRYFAHMESVLGLKKDCWLNTKVEAAAYHAESDKWLVQFSDGRTVSTRVLIAGIGFAAERHFPDWPGLDEFKGEIHHSSFWPHEGVDVKGKKVAVVGTGATGVQIIQETAKEIGDDGHLTVFQRTPNIAFPMRQKKLSKERQDDDRAHLAQALKDRLDTVAGFSFDTCSRLFKDETPEQRAERFDEIWQLGGFLPLISSYGDILLDQEANDAAYEHWARNTRERLNDPKAKDLLAPLTPPHAFGGKRPSLEQDYYEQYNRPNVDIVSTKETPIKEVTPDGIVTEDGKFREFDIIAMATGFDAVTGGIKKIHMQGLDGQILNEKWSDGTITHLGMSISGFPNFYMLYGPQAPTAFSNGPSCVEIQADWILQACRHMRQNGLTRMNTKESAEQGWNKELHAMHALTLRRHVDGWYNGANIPGKKKEPLNYAGGIPRYRGFLREETEAGYPGFVLS